MVYLQNSFSDQATRIVNLGREWITGTLLSLLGCNSRGTVFFGSYQREIPKSIKKYLGGRSVRLNCLARTIKVVAQGCQASGYIDLSIETFNIEISRRMSLAHESQ